MAEVAAVLAMIYSVRPELTHVEGKDLLLKNVLPLHSLKGITVTGGMLRADKALAAALGQ